MGGSVKATTTTANNYHHKDLRYFVISIFKCAERGREYRQPTKQGNEIITLSRSRISMFTYFGRQHYNSLFRAIRTADSHKLLTKAPKSAPMDTTSETATLVLPKSLSTTFPLTTPTQTRNHLNRKHLSRK